MTFNHSFDVKFCQIGATPLLANHHKVSSKLCTQLQQHTKLLSVPINVFCKAGMQPS